MQITINCIHIVIKEELLFVWLRLSVRKLKGASLVEPKQSDMARKLSLFLDNQNKPHHIRHISK